MVLLLVGVQEVLDEPVCFLCFGMDFYAFPQVDCVSVIDVVGFLVCCYLVVAVFVPYYYWRYFCFWGCLMVDPLFLTVRAACL